VVCSRNALTAGQDGGNLNRAVFFERDICGLGQGERVHAVLDRGRHRRALDHRIYKGRPFNAKGPHAGFAKRAAINAPIQGTAADVIRRAMIRMPGAIVDMPAKMLLQVHDELIFEVDENAVDPLIDTARDVMENASDPAVRLDVKLAVDAGQGANWAEAH